MLKVESHLQAEGSIAVWVIRHLRVGYLLLDLNKRGRDVRRFVAGLEGWLIATLADLGVAARQEPGRIGIKISKFENRERGRVWASSGSR